MAKNILIVDDAAFMRMMIKDILTKNGYTMQRVLCVQQWDSRQWLLKQSNPALRTLLSSPSKQNVYWKPSKKLWDNRITVEIEKGQRAFFLF